MDISKVQLRNAMLRLIQQKQYGQKKVRVVIKKVNKKKSSFFNKTKSKSKNVQLYCSFKVPKFMLNKISPLEIRRALRKVSLDTIKMAIKDKYK